MNIFKCADCHEESWFMDGTDGHCLRCEKTKITISPGESAPAPTIHTGFCMACGVTTIHQKPIVACSNCGKELSSEPQEIRVEALTLNEQPQARPSPLPDNSHYAKLKMQPWGYIIANELNFFEGNVVKYVTRWRHKNGLDDLRKARVYIDELIRQEEAKEKP